MNTVMKALSVIFSGFFVLGFCYLVYQIDWVRHYERVAIAARDERKRRAMERAAGRKRGLSAYEI